MSVGQSVKSRLCFVCPYKCLVYFCVNVLVQPIKSSDTGAMGLLSEPNREIDSDFNLNATFATVLQDEIEESRMSTRRTDVLRCYCNLPECVATAYMCKSFEGACFTKPLQPGVGPGRYRGSLEAPVKGCIELLPLIDKEICHEYMKTKRKKGLSNHALPDEDPSTPPTPTKAPEDAPEEPEAQLECCTDDVCNFEEYLRAIYVDGGNDAHASSNRQMEGGHGLFFFNAATITVPIFGLFFLVALVFLARRILNSSGYATKGYLQDAKDQPLKLPLFVGGSSEISSSTDIAGEGPILCVESLLQRSGGRISSSALPKPFQKHPCPPPSGSPASRCGDSSTSAYSSSSTVYSKDISSATLEELRPLSEGEVRSQGAAKSAS